MNPTAQRRDVARFTILAVAAVAVLLQAVPASAYDSGQGELETRFSAKVAKERTRQNTLQQNQDRRSRLDSRYGQDSAAECGSQSIGNVNSNGRIGSQPREVFVYAPNSVNVVTRGGCR